MNNKVAVRGKQYTYRRTSDDRYLTTKLTIGKDPISGKQKQTSVYGKTVEDLAINIENLFFQQIQAPLSHKTVEVVFDHWYKLKEPSLKPNSRVSYQNYIYNKIIKHLGQYRFSDLNETLVQEFFNKLQATGLGEQSIKHIRSVLSAGFEYAIRQRIMTYNYSNDVYLPRAAYKEAYSLSDEETKRFIYECERDVYGLLYLICLFTGMRIAEVQALSTRQVRRDRKSIIVDQLLIRDNVLPGVPRFIQDSTKGGNDRTIYPLPVVFDIIDFAVKRQEVQKKEYGSKWHNLNNLIFTNPDGSPTIYRNIYNHINKIFNKIGCPQATLHSLRHTAASIALRCSNNPRTVQALIGHTTLARTLRYCHASREQQIIAALSSQELILPLLPESLKTNLNLHNND